ncbi:MAG: transcription termination factor NusA [Chloroflexota bacterium]
MLNELQSAFNEIADTRALPPDVVLEALQSALVSAYRRDSNASSAQNIEARIDPATGRARIFVEREVTEDIMSPDTEVTLEKARFYDPEAQIGDTVMVQVENTTKSFGRIAAQTAKQVILQKIREAERNALYSEYIQREGDLIFGTVQSINSQVVTLRLGERAEAILPRSQQIPRERYRTHEKVRVYIMEVKMSNKGPQIVTSRSHRNMLQRLLEYEVPEINNGQVEIKSIAREAGYRSKVAVAALQEGVDPVGACVGMRGIRIQNIVKELHDEKIDVIEWSSDAENFISKALSPARVNGVYLDDDLHTGRTAIVVVPDDQLSLAIGREGQNARLAAKLTGWRIDIKSVTETVSGALENLDMPPLDVLTSSHAQLIEDVRGIMQKREDKKAIMPEEFKLLGKFANLVERRLQKMRDEIRREALEQINAVRETLPPTLFEIPIDALELHESVNEALFELGSVGEVTLATLADERTLERLLRKVDGEPLAEVQEALDEFMSADLDFEEVASAYTVEEATYDEVDETAEPVAAVTAEAPSDIAEEAVAEIEEAVEDAIDDITVDTVEAPTAEEEEVVLDAFGGIVTTEEEQDDTQEDVLPEEPEVEEAEEPSYDDIAAFYVDDELYDEQEMPKQGKKKDRRKRRRLVYDEDKGEVVAKRRRKQNRRRDAWQDDIDY